jgi:hypothetical protein
MSNGVEYTFHPMRVADPKLSLGLGVETPGVMAWYDLRSLLEAADLLKFLEKVG